MLEERNLRTFRVIFLFLITAMFCLFSAGRMAFAAEQVDQSNLPEWAGGWTHINPDPNGQARMWQTFTPNYSNITAVEIDILTVNPGDFNDIITVEIAKDGKILASTEHNVEYGFEGLLRFKFAETVPVIPGELYELKVRDTGLTRFGWKYASNTYDAGTRYVSASERPGTDWFFRTYSLKPHIIYVDDDAAGANNGSSWENAYNDLQDALADAEVATKPIEICVAQGIYKPYQGSWEKATDSIVSFQLINDVTIAGGYAGFGKSDPNARDIKLYETILSGDLNGDDIDVNDPCDMLLVQFNRGDNSDHVVKGSDTDSSAILDGFTITAGHLMAVSMGPPTGGAGVYISSGSPTIINCTFRGNAASQAGGGIYNIAGCPMLIDCKFENNYAEFGAGMYNFTTMYIPQRSKPILINCSFNGNYSGREGGGIYNFKSDPNLTNCAFSHNVALVYGAGIYNSYSNTELINTLFIENAAGSGGGIYSEDNSSLIVTNCNFRNNIAKAVFGGGICNWDANELIVTNCTFSGNVAMRDGGGILNRRTSSTLKNCIFTGNKAYGELLYTGEGGGLYAFGDTILNNCTFSGNWAHQGRAIYRNNSSFLKLSNCILWDGGNDIFQTSGTESDIMYSNIQGGWPGYGNIDVDPLFADPGYWADVDDPNIAVEPNDPNAIWIDGDYHLKSQAGRWDPVSESWVIDDVTSPCIDDGDPNSPVGDEPAPNGGRINMGAYGGTAEASKSFTSELFQTTQELIRVYGFKPGK